MTENGDVSWDVSVQDGFWGIECRRGSFLTDYSADESKKFQKNFYKVIDSDEWEWYNTVTTDNTVNTD